MIPEEWQTEVKDETVEQYKVLKGLLHDRKVESVVCATERGKERDGMRGKSLGRQGAEWIQGLFALLLVLLALLTLHDMQTAEGTGFYLAIKAGAQDRRLYDFAVDAAGMFCLLALLLLPCALQKRLRPGPVLRFASACLAFLPVASTASLVHLADGTEEIRLRQAIAQGRLWAALLEGLGELLPVLAAGLPILILAFGMVRTGHGERAFGKARAGSRISRAAGAMALMLTIVALLFPALTAPCLYLLAYMLLTIAFSLWERLYDENPGLNAWGWILFGGCWLRAAERMLEVMSVYHI